MRGFLFGAALAVLWGGTALAQPGEADSANVNADPNADIDAENLDQAARLIFEAASRAYEAGNFEEALSRYRNAYELSGRAPLLYNIAICHDRLEQKEEAAENYERFVEEVPDSPRVSIARSRAEILRASLAPAPVEDEPDETETEAPIDPVVPEREGRSLAGPIAAFGVGGAGLVTFVVAGLISNSRLSSAEDTCASASGCDLSELDDVDRASLIADIGLGLAVAGTAVGVIWLLVGGGSDDDTAGVDFQPIADRETLGAQLRGNF